jgi:AcrR family transcriptional regulator
MSRAKYSPEKQRSIMATFINATAEIIREQGIEGISIRNVATRAGYSSATLYLYFDDIDQLVALTSVSYLRDYIADIAQKSSEYEDVKELYLYTWESFCRHSFTHASVFATLFFGQYGSSVDETVKKYYSIFPQELDRISSKALAMLMAGDLYKRNMNMLTQYTSQAGFSKKRERLVNEMSVSYYRTFLERACAIENITEEQIAELTDAFMEGARWLLEDRHE